MRLAAAETTEAWSSGSMLFEKDKKSCALCEMQGSHHIISRDSASNFLSSADDCSAAY